MDFQLAAPRSRWIDVGRGLGGLVVVVALVLGVPAALGAWVGWPLPRGVPNVDEITSALRDTYIPDTFLVKGLALVCWVVWAQLVASLVVEAVACARGRAAAPVPLARGMQRTAARLIATVALLGALAAHKGVPDLASRAVAPFLSGDPSATLVIDPAEPTGVAAAPPVAALPVYEVQRYDTLWDISEHHLADPFRWVEIFELNRGRPQGDGSALTDPDRIFPGWVLQMPADAAGLAAPLVPTKESPEAPVAPVDTAGTSQGDETMTLIDAGGSGGGLLAGGGSGGGGDDMMVLLPERSSIAEEPPVMAEPPSDEAPPDEAPAEAAPPDEVAQPRSTVNRRRAPVRARPGS